MSSRIIMVDAETAKAGVTKIENAVRTAQAAIPGLVDEIESAGTKKPWGNDAAGRDFDHRYAPAPEALAAVTTLLAALDQMVGGLNTGLSGTVADDQRTAIGLTKASAMVDVPSLKF